MTRQSLIAIAFAVAVSPFFAVNAADAGWRSRAPEGDHVTATSRHGNGTVSGPVRRTRYGYEVRLPHGTWVGCRTSCSETLRVETVDIWEGSRDEAAGAGTLNNECGIFGCLDFRAF